MHEQSIFIEALEKEDPAERAAFLDRICAGDPALRQRIERLLYRHQQADNFLDRPAVALDTTGDAPLNERPGTVIGPYKLLEQIGEGGFGIVFMAEQQQPVRRKVALKVLKPGMDTRQVVARFEAERQALALMDHPNIAHVFDGGTISEPGCVSAGRPYFVMELVKGIPITDYCDQSRLTPRERLELFLPVCRAVQHAHQKGVIHRDLKPSNVLVTLHDGTPVVKVIDFGVAKAVGRQLTDKTLFTGFTQLVGTPLYMSPEQAALSGLDVDTRSDIYSLGVLLYELLTGTTPFDQERLRQAGYDELRRIIREEEPPKPSTRLSTLGPAAVTVAERRHSDPRRLGQFLRGELDWIVMKALEKDRNRRYESASAFAADVQRYLHHEPVLACPPTAAYQLRKFVHKYGKLLVTATAFIALLLTVVLVVSVAALRLRDQLQQTRQAQRDGRYRLYEARLAEAQSRRWSGRVGQRFGSWQALTEAAQIARELELDESRWLELRNEAIACLALVDVRLVEEWPGFPAGTGDAMSFDGDLEHYARCDANRTISIRRVADDQELTRLQAGRRHSWLLLSPDGNWLVELNDLNHTLLVWDWRRGVIVFRLGPPEKTGAAFTPDSRRMVVSQADGTITLFEVGTWKALRRLRVDFKPGNAALHPDGTTVAIAGDQRVEVRDWASGRLLRRLAHPGWTSAAWHPNGTLLAVACADANVYLWNTATGRPHAILQGHQANVIRVAFSPDGSLLLTTSWDRTSRIWDPWSGRQLLAGLAGLPATTFGLSRDGRKLATRSGEKLSLWEVNAGREYSCLPEVRRIDGYGPPGISPNGRWLAAAHRSGVELRELPGGRARAVLPLGDTTAAVFHPTGRELFTGGVAGVYAWPLQTDGHALRIGPPRCLVKGRCGRLSLDQQGRRLAVLQGGGGRILDLEHPSDRVIAFHHQNARSLAVSPDGRWVASGCWNGPGIKVWEASSGRLVQDLFPDVMAADVLFSPDGRWLVTSTDNGFGFWDVTSWQRVRRVSREREDPQVGGMAFSPDGKVLALCTARNAVQLVDPATGRLFAKLQAPVSDWFRSICFNPDGSRLVATTTIHKDQSILRVWDLRRIREHLQDIGLDWGLPPYPPPPARDAASPGEVTMDLGDLALSPGLNGPRYKVGLCSFILALNPFNFQAYLRRGHAYAELGEVPKAAEDYRRAAAFMPAHHRRCSVRFAAVVEDAEALRDYVKALGALLQSLGSDATEANNLAWQFVTGPEEARDPVQALALAERAAALRPGDGVVLNTLGVIYYRLGWYEPARATLERSLAVNSAQAHDLFFLAMCHARRGDREKARECYDRAVRWVQQRPGNLPAGWREELAVFRAEAAELLGINQEN